MAELEKGTIAYELNELASAKADIMDALSAALEGTNAEGQVYNIPFIEYGNLIKAITAINTKSCSGYDDTDLSLNSLYSLNRMVVYYIISSEYNHYGKGVWPHPSGFNEEDFWLLSFCDASNLKLQIAWVINTKNSIYVRNGLADGSWEGWIEFETPSEMFATISSNYLTKADASTIYATKAEVNNLNTATSGSGAPTISGTAGQIYVDKTNKSVYIHDSEK